MSNLTVVDLDEWTRARKELLARETELNQARAEIAAARQALPVTPVTKSYRFEGREGEVLLPDLFGQHPQLIVYHYMFAPDWEQGCKHCALLVDNIGHQAHLHARDTRLVIVSRAPWAKIEPFQRRMGWTLPWYSSFGSDFNYDFHATLDEEVAPVEYNYMTKAELEKAGDSTHGEVAGLSAFIRDAGSVYHSYSSYDGEDALYGTFGWLDLTPLGRREEDRSWLRHHDSYGG